jgi:hypothetical protein
MCGAAEHLALGNSQSARDLVQADNIGLTQRGLAFRAVAINPCDVVRLLSGGFYKVPQEGLFVFGYIHACTKWGWAAGRSRPAR